MPDDASPNGTDSESSRKRPSWYVPIKPIPDDGRTVQDALGMLEVVGPDDDLGDAAADIDAYLERIWRKGST